MFMEETSGKPSVCDWLTLTIQYITIQGGFWVGSQPNPNPKPANVLVALCDK